MVAFNCFPQFVAKILDGSKRHTFRTTHRCNPGETMRFYQGLRSSKCKFVAEVKCSHVVEAVIDPSMVRAGPYVYSLATSELLFRRFKMWPDILPGGPKCLPLEYFARADGFYDHAEMMRFFNSIYPKGIQIRGFLHVWEPITKPAMRPLAKKPSNAGRAAIKKRKTVKC